MDFNTPLKSRLDGLVAAGNYRTFAQLDPEGCQFPYAVHKGLTPPGPVLIWCSNDYLGMSHNPVVVAAVCDAARNSGVGSGGSRNIAGTTVYHANLEAQLAALHRKNRSVVFASAYLANESLFRILGKAYEHCTFFSDEQNHASIIQG